MYALLIQILLTSTGAPQDSGVQFEPKIYTLDQCIKEMGRLRAYQTTTNDKTKAECIIVTPNSLIELKNSAQEKIGR